MQRSSARDALTCIHLAKALGVQHVLPECGGAVGVLLLVLEVSSVVLADAMRRRGCRHVVDTGEVVLRVQRADDGLRGHGLGARLAGWAACPSWSEHI